MTASPRSEWQLPCTPKDHPGLITFWDFQDEGARRSGAGEAYALHEMAGAVRRVAATDSPFGPWAADLAEGQWLRSARRDCPRLDRHGRDGHLTVLAWIKRRRTATRHCEFLAGQWNESNHGRQYGLFLNIGTWGGADQICGHVSKTGGPTCGYRYCMDGALGLTPLGWDAWHVVGMSYDGIQAMAWLDGRLDRQEGLNPYHYAGGLNDGGADGSDFTVGAVHRSGEMGNFFNGLLGGLAVFDQALSPAEIWALSRPASAAG